MGMLPVTPEKIGFVRIKISNINWRVKQCILFFFFSFWFKTTDLLFYNSGGHQKSDMDLNELNLLAGLTSFLEVLGKNLFLHLFSF